MSEEERYAYGADELEGVLEQLKTVNSVLQGAVFQVIEGGAIVKTAGIKEIKPENFEFYLKPESKTERDPGVVVNGEHFVHVRTMEVEGDEKNKVQLYISTNKLDLGTQHPEKIGCVLINHEMDFFVLALFTENEMKLNACDVHTKCVKDMCEE